MELFLIYETFDKWNLFRIQSIDAAKEFDEHKYEETDRKNMNSPHMAQMISKINN